MSDNIITKKSEVAQQFFRAAERMDKELQALRQKCRPLLGGHRYLTDAELSKRLKINRRTLQEYRTNGKIPYYKFGGKVFYREAEIEALLQMNYHPPYGKERL